MPRLELGRGVREAGIGQPGRVFGELLVHVEASQAHRLSDWPFARQLLVEVTGECQRRTVGYWPQCAYERAARNSDGGDSCGQLGPVMNSPKAAAIPTTRLPRYYEPLRHPERPGLALTGIRLSSRDSPLGAPMLRRISVCRHATANTPVGPRERVAS
jgi:hypothetical protein